MKWFLFFLLICVTGINCAPQKKVTFSSKYEKLQYGEFEKKKEGYAKKVDDPESLDQEYKLYSIHFGLNDEERIKEPQLIQQPKKLEKNSEFGISCWDVFSFCVGGFPAVWIYRNMIQQKEEPPHAT